MKKIIFFGFSVTAEKNGFVDRISIEGAKVLKIGIGGLHPNHAKYFLEYGIRQVGLGNFVVLDFATSGFRNWLSKKNYCISLLSILNDIFNIGATPMLLDLPRRDTLTENDWVEDLHKKISNKIKIPYLNLRLLPLKYFKAPENFLRDIVHPKEAGVNYYSSEIERYLASVIYKDFSQSPIRFKKLINLNGNIFHKNFDFLPIHKCLDHDFNNYEDCIRQFNRTGIKLDIFEIREGEKVKFLMPSEISKKVRISGMAYLMGPRSGNIHFQVDKINAKPKKIVAYDQFCYYERLGAIEFDIKYSGSDFFINQYSGTPSMPLLKGEKNYMPRIASIAGIFLDFESKINLDNILN